MKKTAFVFPGQGSQAVGMSTELAAQFPVVQETYRQASQVLGYDLWDLVANGPEEKLNQTEYTQPALLTAEVAMWCIYRTGTACRAPTYMAGHSLGEYSALVCAGAIEFTDAVKLVAARGELMQEAVPAGTGGMVAVIGLDKDQIQEVCEKAAEGQILAPANYNSIGQVVLSGHLEAAERAVVIAKGMGAKIVKLLAVSVPSHCELMHPAASKLAEQLSTIDIKKPVIPVISNFAVSAYNTEADIKEGLVKQLYSPVRWVETIQFFHDSNIEELVEFGPGKVLAGLNKRIVKELPTINFTQFIEGELCKS